METHLKMLDRPSFTECWLTVVSSQMDDLHRHVASSLAEHGIQPVQEKIYAPAEVRPGLLRQRGAAYEAVGLEPTLPFTYLSARPGLEPGVQVWGLIPRGGASVTSVGRGRLWQGPGYRMLYLPSLAGPSGKGPPEQAEAMFCLAEEALLEQGMTFRDVGRTWIYLARLLDWYGDFNRVRSAFFVERGVGESVPFPASTGIQGRCAGEACLMDVLAYQPGPDRGCHLRPLLESARQDRPSLYGSAFSRGLAVTVEQRQTVFVSGTASIGRDGATRHRHSPESQLLETLMCIGALLETCGGSLGDVTQATLFCKDPAYGQVYRDVSRWLGLAHLPVIPVVADVCRPDLLVEIEAVAAIGAGR